MIPTIPMPPPVRLAAPRTAAARLLGEEFGQLCLEFAERNDANFGARAYAFVVRYVAEHGPVPGEEVTLAAREAGIRAHDDRAMGPVFARAIRQGAIRAVGYCARVRGNGTAGGRLYGPGEPIVEGRTT